MATSPLDYILQGARKILDKGQDAFRDASSRIIPPPSKFTTVIPPPSKFTPTFGQSINQASLKLQQDAKNRALQAQARPKVRQQDWYDVANIVPIMAGYLAEPAVSGALSLAEVVMGKQLPKYGVPLFKGETALNAQGAKSYYDELVTSGVDPDKAYWSTAIKTGIDMSMLVSIARTGLKLGVKAVSPQSLIKIDVTNVSKQNIFDYLLGRKTATELDIPQALREAMAETFKSGTPQEKMGLLKGIDIAKVQPSRLGKVLGLSEGEANRILSNLYGFVGGTRKPVSGFLPGYMEAPLNFQAGKIGKGGFKKGKPVGFADNLTTNVKAIMETGKPLPRTPVLPSNLLPVASKAAMAKMEPPKIRQMKTSAEIPSLERTAEMQGVTPKPNEIKLPKQTQVGVEKVQQGYTNRQSQTPTIPLKSSSYKDNTTAMIERKRAFETPTTPLGIYGKLQQSLSPVKFLDEVSQKIYKDWSRTVEKAKVLGDKELSTFKIPTKDSWQSILDYQAGKKTALTGEIKNKFDSLFKEAGARGLDIGYNERYLPQVYKESANEIKDKIAQYLLKNGMSKEEILAYQNGKKLSGDIARRLKLNPFFSKEKVFPDYKTAMEYGLTPKYKDLNQLVAHYRKEMETTLANRNFIESLINTDKLLLVDDAPSNWKPVELPFSIKGYYADPRLAKVLNGLFGVEKGFLDTVFSVGASASRRAQEISLSAGIPYTSVNFFSIGQLIKEMTSGNFKAVIPFVRANFGEKSLEYFNKNRNYLEMMADEGLRLGDHVGTLGNTYKNLAGKKKFWEGLGVKFDKAFNEKTFAGFMPQLYTQTFKDIYLKGIKSGLGEKEARALAGETVKKAFGLIEDFGRSGKTEDKLSAIFFAPKFREGVVNTLKNTAKSGLEFVYKLGGTKAPLDPAFTKNRKLLAGMIITYGIYNAVNYVLNDNFMWNNPENRKFALQIPRKGGELIYVEFMPSFLAFARNIISGGVNLATGDVKGATQKLGSLLSMPVKTSTEVIANKDYFGNEIYKDEDSALVKAGKIAKYVGLAVNHPYIKEIINQIGDKKPLYQSTAMALELPVKFGSVQKVSKSKEFGGNLTLKDIQKSIKADVESGKIDTETAVESYIGQRQALIENRKKERLGMSLSEFKKSLASDIKEGLVTEDEGVEEYISYKQEEEQQAKREEQMKETYPDRNLVNLVIDYAKAYKTDPVMAWKAMVTREKLDKVAGDKVTLQRFFGKHYLDPTEGSEAYMKKELNKLGIAWSERENYNLEHIIPLTAGGDNSSNNLQIISRELHNTYTPVDTKAGKAVESGKLSRRQVARIMRQLKIDKTISVQQALNML